MMERLARKSRAHECTFAPVRPHVGNGHTFFEQVQPLRWRLHLGRSVAVYDCDVGTIGATITRTAAFADLACARVFDACLAPTVDTSVEQVADGHQSFPNR